MFIRVFKESHRQNRSAVLRQRFRIKTAFSPRGICVSSYKFCSGFYFTRAGSAVQYTYDKNSNRLLGFSQTNTAKRLNAKGLPVTSTTSTQISYGLDAAGNLTSDGLRTFSYDPSNRLAQVQVGDSDEASKVIYLHNALGQRVFKSEPQVAQTAPNEAELGTDFITWLKKNFGWMFATAQQNATLGQSFVYADGAIGSYNLLGEYGNGGTKSAGRTEYIWLPTESGPAQLIGLYKGGRFYAVHTDHLGTPRQITDDTNKVVWQWAYSGFGDNKPTGILKATANPQQAFTNQPTLLQATSPNIAMNLRFPGQYWDDESKLSYNYMRSYQSGQGRYTQSDPIGWAGGPNPYAYVGGNPLSRIDPRGLASCTFTMSTGTMVCVPTNPANTPVTIPVASGNNGGGQQCRNNPACTATANRGPIPTGCWRWTNGATGKPNGRVLEPCPGTNTNATENRTLIRSHSCVNPFGPGLGPQYCSEGCVTGTAPDMQNLNGLIDAEPGSTLQVVP